MRESLMGFIGGHAEVQDNQLEQGRRRAEVWG